VLRARPLGAALTIRWVPGPSASAGILGTVDAPERAIEGAAADRPRSDIGWESDVMQYLDAKGNGMSRRAHDPRRANKIGYCDAPSGDGAACAMNAGAR